MENKILFFISILLIFKYINNNGVAELKAEEETSSECYNTNSPKSEKDCIDREVDEGDEYCCLFEIETHKKQNIKRCSGLTEFQYNHIKLYVKEKMDELLYRDFHIHCDSFLIKFNFSIILLYLYL